MVAAFGIGAFPVYTRTVVMNAGRLGCDAGTARLVGKKEKHLGIAEMVSRPSNG